jgi:hypothetical protein
MATKKNAKKQPPKPAATKPAARGLSQLEAAAKVLQKAKKAMHTKDLVEAMERLRYWKSPAGKTPAATLYAALLKEIATKGRKSRFKKAAPGLFASA